MRAATRRGCDAVSVGVLLALLGGARADAQSALAGRGGGPVASTAASAKPPAAKLALAGTLTGQALDAYDAGRLLFTDGDAAGALVKFRQAYELSREPRLLWNMAVCEKALRHYQRTRVLIARYLAESPNVSADERSQAEETMAVIARLVGRVNVVVEEPGAKLLVDGEIAGETPVGPLELDIGRHVIRVEKADFTSAQETVEIVGGAERQVTLVLVRAPRSGTLIVHAPEAAAIAVDGQVRGRGSWSGQLESGSHAVRVTSPGHRDYTSTVDISPGGTRSLDVTLEAKPARWPWIVGAGVVVAGAAVGGYFLLRPKPDPTSSTRGTLDPEQIRLPLSPAGVAF